MDPGDMYPQGYHVQHINFLPNIKNPAPHVPRIASRLPVKYYYVDFGISSMFTPEHIPKLVVGRDGRDREVPELSGRTPYDPFKVDVFIIGNLLRKELHTVSLGLPYFHALLIATPEIHECWLSPTAH